MMICVGLKCQLNQNTLLTPSQFRKISGPLTLDAGVSCLSKLECMREISLSVIAIPLIEADGTAVITTHHLRWTESANIDQRECQSV